jgi:hypothetical protein
VAGRNGRGTESGQPGGSPDGSPEGHPQGSPDGSPEGVPGGTGSARSRTEELERQLEGALGDFDGRILEERAVIIARDSRAGGPLEAPERPAESAGGGEGQGSGTGSEGASEAPSRRPAPPPPSSGSGRGGVPDRPAEDREGDYEQVARAPEVPPDIPDGSDDDVIARQLREAAMNEEDPELREKLWDEYRNYKASQ